MKKFTIIIFLSLSIINSLTAQWSADSTMNAVICDVTGEQSVPKISLTQDGGCYVAWFDSRSGSYAIYLQRLNANGVKQFANDGLLISSNPQSSSLADWDIITDDSNNCVIVFTDTRNGSSINPFAYRISSTGTFLWGPNGITLTDSSNIYQPNPKVVKTSYGNFVVAWIRSTTPNRICLQKLSPSGTKLWNGGNPVLHHSGVAGENFTYPALLSSDSGSVLFMWSCYTGTFLSPQNYKIQIQKMNGAGNIVWKDTVYSLGKVSGYFVPKFISNGQNGALCVWQDDRQSNNIQRSFIQHYTSTGAKLFPINGIACSSTPSRHSFDAWAAYMPQTQEIYMVWKESNSLQTSFGIFGQKINSSGIRQWSEGGIAFKDLSTTSSVNQLCYVKDTTILFFYNETETGTANYIKCFKTDRSGNHLWNGIRYLSSITSSKSKISGIVNQSGMSAIIWSDGRNDGGGIYGQNINYNGTLGIITSIKKGDNVIPDKIILEQNFPNPFNPRTKINFSIPKEANCKLNIYDISGKEIINLVDKKLNNGNYTVEFNGNNFSSGVYYYKLTADDISVTKSMILIK